MNERGGDANGRGAVAEKTSEPPPSKVEALDGSNYEEWSGRMRSAFKRYKLLKIAVGEEKMPEEGEARERWIEKSAVLFDLILQSVNKEMFEHIKDLVEADDSGPRAWKLLPAGSSVSQLQQCTKIISVLDNSWDNLIPTLNSQQDQWTPEWLRQQILQEDFRRRHVGGGAATKTAEGYGAAGRSRGRGGWRGRGRGRSFGRGRGRGDYNEGHGSSSGRGSTRMEGTCWYCKKIGHPWFKCFSRPEGWAPPGMKPPSGERAQGGAVQGSGAQGEGAQGNAYPGLFLMVEDVHGHEGDVGFVGKVVMHPLTHWVIDSGCTSHMTPRADLLDEVKGANGELVGLGNVLLVEGLSANLLSVRRLQKSKAEVTFGPTSCRAKLGKKVLWSLEEETSCIKDLWQLPIIPWNGKTPTAATAAAAKATAGGDATAPIDGVLEAVKKLEAAKSFNSVKADGTSIGGYVCLLGGGAVSWRSKKQNEVGLSSCETEYMALHHGAKEVVWLRRLLEELGVGQEKPTVVFCDNESAVKLAKNACLHGLTKHIRPKWHWVRRLLDKEVRLEIVKTHQQAADIFTKRLAEADHWKGMKLAGMSVH
ncbi:hypothetical protein CLOM_g11683 [Closterium sp. NIES-68]|nr:hypothetical protein CLOM_g11683 [Closterium sp. NIES-68]